MAPPFYNDHMRYGAYQEPAAYELGVLYGFRLFRNRDAVFIIDVVALPPEGGDGARVQPDFLIASPKGNLLVGEVKSSNDGGDSKNVDAQVEAGVEKLREYPVDGERMLVLPLGGEVPNLDRILRETLKCTTFEKKAVCGSLVAFYRAVVDGRKWTVIAYELSQIELALSMVLTEEGFDPGPAHERLGRFVRETITYPHVSALVNREEFVAGRRPRVELIKENLLPGDFPSEEAQLALMLEEPWSFLTQEYLETSSALLAEKEPWTRILRDALARQPGRPEARRNLRPMSPSFLDDSEIRRNTGVRIASKLPWSAVTVIEAPPGAGKSVTLQRLAGTLSHAYLYSGGSIDLPHLPVYVDLKQLSHQELADAAAQDRNDPMLKLDEQDAERHGLSLLARLCRHELPADEGAREALVEPNVASDPRCLKALLCRFPLLVLIDGYDYVVSQKMTGPFRAWLTNLEKAGIVVKRVIVTSRRGYGVHDALEWKLNSRLERPTGRSLGELRNRELRMYAAQWFEAVGDAFVPANGQPPKMNYTNFKGWLDARFAAQAAGALPLSVKAHQTFTKTRPRLEDACKKTPLLYNLTLLAYVRQEMSLWINEGDVIEQIFAGPDPDQPSYRGGWNASAPRRELERLAFDLLCRPSARLLGEAPASTVFHTGGSTTTVGKWASEPNQALLRSQPFCTYEGDAETGKLVFQHALFQEYVAACHLARSLLDERDPGGTTHVPLAGGRQISLSARRGPTPNELEEAARGLAETLENVGPRVFKYFVGILWKESSSIHALMLFKTLARSVALQQFLYDAGYLDEAEPELVGMLCARWDSWRQMDEWPTALKLLAHIGYGSSEDERKAVGVELMEESKAVLASRANDPSLLQLSVFLDDHILHRKKTGPDDVLIGEEERARAERVLAEALPGLPANGEPAPTSPLLLRAGHFWGHVGNQRLDQLRGSLRTWKGGDPPISHSQFDEIEECYRRAAMFRAACLHTLGDAQRVSGALDTLAMFWDLPDWIHTRAAIEGAEGFVNFQQAIGDVANQLTCAANTKLWRYLLHRGDIEQLEQSVNAASTAWDLAFQGHSEHGAPMIRYYVWLPATTLGLRIAQGERHSESFIESTLDDAERRARQPYAIARKGVVGSLALMQKCCDLGARSRAH